MINWFVITPLFVTSVMKNSVKTECVIIVICLVSLEVLHMKPANSNTRFQSFSHLYFTICLAMISTYLLKLWEIAKELFTFIRNNEENHISFTKQVIVDKCVNKEEKEVNVKRELRFIDSLRFTASSLDKLSSNLKIDQFINKFFSGNQLSLLLRKSVYPYYYVDCMKKIDETSLPPKDAFYSNLTGEGITDEDYQHAQTVWKEFNIETMKDYHNFVQSV